MCGGGGGGGVFCNLAATSVLPLCFEKLLRSYLIAGVNQHNLTCLGEKQRKLASYGIRAKISPFGHLFYEGST